MERIGDESEGVSVEPDCCKSAQLLRILKDHEPPISAKKKLEEMQMMIDSFVALLSGTFAIGMIDRLTKKEVSRKKYCL